MSPLLVAIKVGDFIGLSIVVLWCFLCSNMFEHVVHLRVGFGVETEFVEVEQEIVY